MLKTAINKITNLFNIVTCSICEKKFDKTLPSTFESEKSFGPVVYFCPDCNKNLRCSGCGEEVGTKLFKLSTKKGKRVRDVEILCVYCLRKIHRAIREKMKAVEKKE